MTEYRHEFSTACARRWMPIILLMSRSMRTNGADQSSPISLYEGQYLTGGRIGLSAPTLSHVCQLRGADFCYHFGCETAAAGN